MFARIATLQLHPEHVESALHAHATVAVPRVRAAPGNLDCYLLEPVSAGEPFLACTLWESEAAALDYERGGAAQETAALLRHAFAASPQLRTYRSRSR